MAESIRDLVPLLQAELCSFLERTLPGVAGENWWGEAVVAVLSVSQARAVTGQRVATLKGLDLASLLRVMDKNWYGISNALHLPRRGRTYLNELMDVRNRIAHATSQPVDLDMELRDVDTANRFLEILSVPVEVRKPFQEMKDRLLARMREASGTVPESPPPEHVQPAGAVVEDSDAEEMEEPGSPAGGSEGLPLNLFGPETGTQPVVVAALEKATYVGIDFGTSTTVVSVVTRDPKTGWLAVRQLPVRQDTRDRGDVVHHLVPTCLAWVHGKLLVGEGAAEYRLIGTEGHDVWSSFKMRLGLDLGPEYRNTVLPRGDGENPTIERPQDAAREFFSFIRNSIEEYVQAEGLPPRIYYSVSVPASFEANQRRDLMQALAGAGIETSESALIDEPNAAFLSHLFDMMGSGTGFLKAFEVRPANVLVFDFGAGTCDISILRIEVREGSITSTNLAISRFLALGGNDIDDVIAREVLLPQLSSPTGKIQNLTTAQLEHVVLPRLRPEAEKLKIACSKQAKTRGLGDLQRLRAAKDAVVGKAITPIKIGADEWRLPEPRITLASFADVMSRFIAEPEGTELEQEAAAKSVLYPIADAIRKACLGKDDVRMVLFIGGSAANPVVQDAVQKYFGRFTECVSPQDLRSHVANGASIHSFLFHGLGKELIQPITSEPIMVVTRGGSTEVLLPAGTAVPSADLRVTELHVESDDQQTIELPLCVSTPDKILHVITIDAPPGRSFAAGTAVRISCSITLQKLLRVKVRVAELKMSVQILNPLANREVSAQERAFLEAQQRFNEAVLRGKGKPGVAAIVEYAEAAAEVERHREAGELLEAAQRMNADRDFATNIAYHYANAGELERTAEWSEAAYRRRRNATTAYNLAITRLQQQKQNEYVQLLKEALQMDAAHTAALVAYGFYLDGRGDSQGRRLLEKALNLLSAELTAGIIDESDEARLGRIAQKLGNQQALRALADHRRSRAKSEALYDEDNLVARRTESGERIKDD